MKLTRFEPWSVVDLLNRDLNRFVVDRSPAKDRTNPVVDWAPAVDIVEEKDRFTLRADLPGVRPEDIELSMDAGVLSVSGERNIDPLGDGEGFRRVERASGRFYRRFSLPDSADATGITAKSSNGILEVNIPKLAEVQARRIAVEAA